MSKIDKTLFRIAIPLTIAAMILIFIIQAKQTKEYRKQDIYRACENTIGWQHKVEELIGNKDVELSAAFYRIEKDDIVEDNDAAELVELSHKNQYVYIRFVPLKTGQYYYFIATDDEIIIGDTFEIKPPSLMFYIKQSFSSLVWEPLKLTVLAPLMWSASGTNVLSSLYKQFSKLGILSIILLILIILTVWLVFKAWGKCYYAVERTGKSDRALFNMFTAGISLGFLVNYTFWEKTDRLPDFLVCGIVTTKFTFYFWLAVFAVTSIVFAVDCIRHITVFSSLGFIILTAMVGIIVMYILQFLAAIVLLFFALSVITCGLVMKASCDFISDIFDTVFPDDD